MANDLAILKSFVDGQGAGAATYTTYAEDHDSNYTDIQNNFNTLNAEVKAFAGQNATLVIDLILSGSSPSIGVGLIDVTSFAPVTFITGDTQMQIPPGVAYTTAGRVELLTISTLTGSGGSGFRYVALQQTGAVTLETALGQGVMDLYQVTWTGAVFTPATLNRLQEIMPGGHDFQNSKIQEDFGQGSDTALPAYTYDRIADRINDIVRVLGYDLASADAGQAALNPIAIGGTSLLAGLIAGDGATYEPSTGLFMNPTLNSVGVTILGTLAMLWDETVVNEPQAILRNGSALATPPLAFATDLNTGLGWVGADHFRAIVNQAAAMEWDMDGTDPKALFVAGSAATVPGLAVIGDLNTGFGGDGSDALRVITNSILAATWNANQQRTSATQGRCSATRGTQTLIPNQATPLTPIILNTAEQYDQGVYHDLATNPDRMTVPTGFDGVHQITATCQFDESTSSSPNANDRELAITVNGTTIANQRVPAATGSDTSLSVSVERALVATDIVRMEVAQNSGGTMSVISSLLTVRLGD